MPPNEDFIHRPQCEAELGWAEKGGQYGYFLATPISLTGFHADEFFRGLSGTRCLALREAPTQTLGPFFVLGYGISGKGTPDAGAKLGDVRDVIRSKFQVAVLLMAPFQTQEQALEFGKALPKLSLD